MTSDEVYKLIEANGLTLHGDIEHFAALVASAEREAIAQAIESAPPLVEHVQNDLGGCAICGFTPKLAAEFIRARGNVATNDTSQERVDETSQSVHEPVAWEQFYPEMGKIKEKNT